MHRGQKLQMKLLKSVLQFRCVARTKMTIDTNFSQMIDNIVGIFDRKSSFVLVNHLKYVFKKKSQLSSEYWDWKNGRGARSYMHDFCYILLPRLQPFLTSPGGFMYSGLRPPQCPLYTRPSFRSWLRSSVCAADPRA